MRVYRPGRSATEIHHELLRALEVAERASGLALLWFSDVLHRHLYRRRGYLSIQDYAEVELGFSPKKTEQFVQLSRLVGKHRRLRRSLTAGRLSWTQVRTIAPVLTEGSEAHWVSRAEALSRRALAEEIRRARAEAAATVRAPGQVRFDAASFDPTTPGCGGSAGAPATPRCGGSTEAPATPGCGGSLVGAPAGDTSRTGASGPLASSGTPSSATSGGTVDAAPRVAPAPAPEVMTTLTLRLRPVDRARLERQIETLRQRGHREGRYQLILAALDLFILSSEGARSKPAVEPSPEPVPELKPEPVPEPEPTHKAEGKTQSTPNPAPRPHEAPMRSAHQVVVRMCPSCGAAATGVGRREVPIDPVTLDTLLCDADVVDARGHRRATIPASVRRRVLARDRHRCTTPGCGATHHLEIHHRIPVAAGGSNDTENLITLCGGCHRSLHEIAHRRSRPPGLARERKQPRGSPLTTDGQSPARSRRRPRAEPRT